MWYAAHIIVVFEPRNGGLEPLAVWENIVLVRAESHAEAMCNAERIGREADGDDHGTLSWEDVPVMQKFAGVRKTVAIGNDDALTEGVELSFNRIGGLNRASVEKLVRGDVVGVTYEE